MTRINLTAEDLARIANDAVANGWPLDKVLHQTTVIASVTHTRIETSTGIVLGRNPAIGYWYPAYLAEAYTRDEHGHEVPLPPRSNLNGLPMTVVEASIIALHETARSGCVDIYRPVLAGEGA